MSPKPLDRATAATPPILEFDPSPHAIIEPSQVADAIARVAVEVD